MGLQCVSSFTVRMQPRSATALPASSMVRRKSLYCPTSWRPKLTERSMSSARSSLGSGLTQLCRGRKRCDSFTCPERAMMRSTSQRSQPRPSCCRRYGEMGLVTRMKKGGRKALTYGSVCLADPRGAGVTKHVLDSSKQLVRDYPNRQKAAHGKGERADQPHV